MPYLKILEVDFLNINSVFLLSGVSSCCCGSPGGQANKLTGLQQFALERFLNKLDAADCGDRWPEAKSPEAVSRGEIENLTAFLAHC